MLALAQVSQEELRSEILHTWEDGREAWRIPIEVFGVDISLTKPVWIMILGMAITFFVMFIGGRFFKNRPGAYQVIVEEIYGFGRKYLGGQMGEEGMKWMPYTLTLFVLLLTLNIIGLVPESYPVTSNISFTLVLAFLTFAITQYQGFKRNGPRAYMASFVIPGLPVKPIMVPFITFTEIIQEFTKPLTLAMRLYASMLAGHLIILVFLSFILYFGTYMVVVSVPLAIVFYAFKIFLSVIQAYIFAILTQIYIEIAMYAGESH